MKLDWEEENDRPRGIVAKANRYAANKVPLGSVELSEPVLAGMQALYLMYFTAFISGAHAAIEIQKERGK